ncbi:hypothetical protein CHS0354_043026 [Potamilus streckersoni]|uniref:Major facilitator superfamily (MFS) profile domain-containing protein n=1 Tax=Potamilus streckersoni TaxID=2493646 RepID=A0AAE0SCY3_9BIVA|nr:hypothetical protein CHS0354_043026 [Potamilus streckersoni]
MHIFSFFMMRDTHLQKAAFPGNYKAASEFAHLAVLPDKLNAHDKDPTISPTVTTEVYIKRWYVLAVFSLFASIQGGVWNTWGPIASASEDAFGWTDSTIALLSNWGAIAYIIFAFPLSWLIVVKGIRWACVSMSFLVALGTGLRCITDNPITATWLIHIGQFLNAVGGPVAYGGSPVISAEWFPPHQRTTATAIGITFNNLGVAAPFLLGPYLVPERKIMNSTYFIDSSPELNNSTESPTFFNLTACGVSVFCFLLVLIYFPNKPPLPPSTSAALERPEFSSGFKSLVRNVTFWQISVVYGVSFGIYGGWISVLDVNLKGHNISETEAGWSGFYATLAGSCSALFVGRLADIFFHHMKKYLITIYILAGISFAVFTLALFEIIPFSSGILYTTLILGGLLLTAAIPLFNEICCEATYPISEGITNFALTMINNVGILVFLLIQMIPNIGTMWQNWCLLGSIVLCLPVLLFLRDRFNRLEVDEERTKPTAGALT